jgi:hypothetical protein
MLVIFAGDFERAVWEIDHREILDAFPCETENVSSTILLHCLKRLRESCGWLRASSQNRSRVRLKPNVSEIERSATIFERHLELLRHFADTRR